MLCKDAETLIHEYMDDRLTREEKNSFLSHVKSCEHCFKELQYYSLIKKELGRLPEEEPPAGLLSGALQKAAEETGAVRKKRLPYRYAAGIAAALVVAVGVFWYVNYEAGREFAPIAPMQAEQYAGGGEEFAAKAAPQMSMAPAASSEAPAAAASEAPAESAAPAASAAAGSQAASASSLSTSAADEAGRDTDDAKNNLDALDTLPVTRVTVSTAKAEGFRTGLLEFLSQNAVLYELDENEEETYLFVVDKANLGAFKALLKEYKISQKLDVIPTAMHIVFSK